MYITLIFITLIIVYVWDVSGFIPSVKRFILRKLIHSENPDDTKVHWPPFDCAQCMTIWICLGYVIMTGTFSIPVLAFICGLSFLTIPIAGVMNLVNDILSWILTTIEKFIFRNI